MKSRKNDRAKKNARQKEERLELQNAYGITDPTPRDMVNNLIDKKGEKEK